MRTGIQLTPGEPRQYGLEELFYKHGVDLELWAHEHTFERMLPVYNRTVSRRSQNTDGCLLQVYNGTDSPYVDPPAPVKDPVGDYVHQPI